MDTQTNAVTLEAYDRLDPKATRALLFLTGYPISYARRRLWWVPLPERTKHQLIQKFTRDDTSVSFVLRLAPKELRAKMSLIRCHRSQFPDEKGRHLDVSLPLLRAFLRDECCVIERGAPARRQLHGDKTPIHDTHLWLTHFGEVDREEWLGTVAVMK